MTKGCVVYFINNAYMLPALVSASQARRLTDPALADVWIVCLDTPGPQASALDEAAAQTGVHNDKRATFGHAMVIDPWGTVVAQCRDGTGLAFADIDLAFVDEVRARIPVWQHRRPDPRDATRYPHRRCRRAAALDALGPRNGGRRRHWSCGQILSRIL